TPETVPLYKASLEIWQTLSQRLDFNIMFTTAGELDLVHTIDALEVERDKSLLNRAYGVQTDILGPDEVLEKCPHVDMSGGGELPVIGASYHPPGSIAHHDSVVWGFAAAAQRLGVHIHEGVGVTGIDVKDGVCSGVQTDAGPVSAGAVVSAVAGYSSIVAAMAGLQLPISTHPLQAFVTEPYAHVFDGLISSMDLYVYISQTARGEFLVGAEILPYNTYSTRSTFDFLAEAARRCIMFLPFVANARAMRQWTGVCDMTPDSSPMLGATEVKNFHLMAGMGTWGFKGSPIFGKLLAEALVTGRMPELIAPFAVDRFERDRMVPDAASAGTH
ncbi:MAG: sarcosine oxidase, subunit beta, partial [Actinomycetota bacterium]|nr:sarcosine oxidase, subunit beta [Actinomycetota bacterium]